MAPDLPGTHLHQSTALHRGEVVVDSDQTPGDLGEEALEVPAPDCRQASSIALWYAADPRGRRTRGPLCPSLTPWNQPAAFSPEEPEDQHHSATGTVC
ncbi:uncharacterized protein Aud_004477 [Aspergillus udagawae]|uniref:Uncharacterized protein n=1 Tax=Aspergillus udagawae TaxID=91492 RepID=A0A8E0QS74_9EURO|nr:uncharacterized protein Aud_004477 [Aspergillus udagawae]GIC88086.1 hypothetical protein Aud_004477 [Aspergillus udagawae]